ncbi:hypothetical protein [Nocardioides sp. AX2bis]|uniref:hypothetical protein n=1 Tax=Nocardioides sp. AX2bis TaxID=2653157 RepID=UPI0012EEF2C2|nr:hypothetical protein [Nocardioides sp. AX2bis]VXC06977.1 exported hypothetical protein [Nocardioides sp. AX2bis]
MTSRRTRARSLLAGLALALAAACSSTGGATPDPTAPAGYEAVPDEELFAAVRALPEVRSADLDHLDQLGQSNDYRAEVRLQPGLSRRELVPVFDRVTEILRHGRWGASTTVLVRSSGETESGTAHDLFTTEDFARFYGEQTGQEGWPPPFVRTG